MVQKKYEVDKLNALWSDLKKHPNVTDEIIRIVNYDIKSSVVFGADKFRYSRNKIQSAIDLLDMLGRVMAKTEGQANEKNI